MRITSSQVMDEEPGGAAAEEYTSLKVTKRLTNKLRDMGKKGESYEDIIWRLIEGNSQNGNLNEGLKELKARMEELETRVRKPGPMEAEKNSRPINKKV